MVRLNSDTSWLLSVPHSSSMPKQVGRSHFNILIDPWLSGSHVDIAPWFSTQWHVSPAHWSTIADIDQDLLRYEANTSAVTSIHDQSRCTSENGETQRIDLVLISDSMTDHCHRDTMIQVSRRVPIYASRNAASIIRRWGHFTTVVDMPDAKTTTELRSDVGAVLPSWLTLFYVHPPFYDPIHGAVVICLEGTAGESEAEAIYYVPHGIAKANLALVRTWCPTLKPLLLLHGLDKVCFARVLTANMGVENAVDLQKNLQAKYWFDTHDEQTESTGLVRYLLSRENYISAEDCGAGLEKLCRLESLGFARIANGDAVLLE